MGELLKVSQVILRTLHKVGVPGRLSSQNRLLNPSTTGFRFVVPTDSLFSDLSRFCRLKDQTSSTVKAGVYWRSVKRSLNHLPPCFSAPINKERSILAQSSALSGISS